MPTAAVVGAQGVIGRYIVDKLAALPDWNVIGLSRRKGTDAPRVRHISVDLLEPADAKAKLAGLGDVTHIFFAAFQPGSGVHTARAEGPNAVWQAMSSLRDVPGPRNAAKHLADLNPVNI